MKSVVVNTVAAKLCWVYWDMSLRCVEDVSYSNTLEIVHVLDGVTVGQDDARKYLNKFD